MLNGTTTVEAESVVNPESKTYDAVLLCQRQDKEKVERLLQFIRSLTHKDGSAVALYVFDDLDDMQSVPYTELLMNCTIQLVYLSKHFINDPLMDHISARMVYVSTQPQKQWNLIPVYSERNWRNPSFRVPMKFKGLRGIVYCDEVGDDWKRQTREVFQCWEEKMKGKVKQGNSQEMQN